MPTFAFSRAALVLAGVTCLATVPPEAQDRPPAAQDRFVLEAGEHDVVDILTKAARFLDRNYVLAPAEMQGAQPVVLQRRIETDRTGCETLVGQLAFARGLALVPKDLALGLWDVINLAGPRRADVAANRTVVPAEDLHRYTQSKLYIATRLALKHLDAGAAAQMLRPFLATGSKHGIQVGSLGDSALLLAGFGDDVAAAVRLVDLADLPPAALPDALEKRLAAIEARLERLEAAR